MQKSLSFALLALGLIIAAAIAAGAYKVKFRSAELITVTGLAEQDFESDLIVWQGSFQRSGTNLKEAYDALKADEAAIRSYLRNASVPDSSVVFESIDVQKTFSNTFDGEGRVNGSVFSGYQLAGKVRVQSSNVASIEKLSREVTSLLQSGIEFASTPPQYYYSKLNNLKISLLAKAAADAKERAESIAENAGEDLGTLKTASMGIFQITGKNMNEDYSYGGSFNTSAKLKTASITLKCSFQID